MKTWLAASLDPSKLLFWFLVFIFILLPWHIRMIVVFKLYAEIVLPSATSLATGFADHSISQPASHRVLFTLTH